MKREKDRISRQDDVCRRLIVDLHMNEFFVVVYHRFIIFKYFIVYIWIHFSLSNHED